MGFEERSKVSDILSIYIPAFFIFLGTGVVSPVLALFARSFQISFALVSLAISMYAVGRLVSNIPVGILADRFGRKPVMLLGTIILSITAFLNGSASDFWVFILLRTLQGVGASMWINGRQTLLADILKPEERGRVLGYFQTFQLIGSAAGPTVGGLAASIWDTRSPFYLYSSLALVSFILSFILVHESESLKTSRVRSDLGFSPRLIWRILTIKGFTMACLASFSISFLTAGLRNMIIPLYGDNVIGLDEAQIGMVLSFATLFNLVLTIPVGYMIDYHGRKSVILKSLYVTAASAFIFTLTSDFLSMSIAALILGVGTSGSQQASLAMATDLTINEPRGLSIGLYRISTDIGFVSGPIILGFIADNYNLRMPFYFMSILLLVNAILILIYAKETYSLKHIRKGEPLK